ncbi:MAG: hypothetical protein HKN71_03310, partial [Gemmatimonadetes bacterium]|nr:hypothetical protein [Gemmatimonadota bacterium]
FKVLEGRDVDFTSFFRRLANAARGNRDGVWALFQETAAINAWLDRWLMRLTHRGESAPSRADAMDRVNPIYIPRSHKVQEALDAAVAGDLEPFRRLLRVLERPFDPREGLEEFAVRAPYDFGRYTTFCGT